LTFIRTSAGSREAREPCARLWTVSTDVAGPTRPPATAPLAQRLADRLGRPARIIIRWTERPEDTAEFRSG
jgi:hypothetical protein